MTIDPLNAAKALVRRHSFHFLKSHNLQPALKGGTFYDTNPMTSETVSTEAMVDTRIAADTRCGATL